jgi:hypothetical protein
MQILKHVYLLSCNYQTIYKGISYIPIEEPNWPH